MATSNRLENDTSDSEEDPSILRGFTSAQSSVEGKPSPLTSLLTKTQTLTPSSLLPLLLTALLLSGRGEVPIISGPANYRPNIVQILKELAPEVNCNLVLQYLSEVDTDYLVECGLEIARRYRQLEEENESYRQRKEVFANLYEKEKGKVKELDTRIARTTRAMEKMKKENANVLEQVRQDYLNERRQLEAECERLRCVLKYKEEEWMKEKQLLLEQIRNVSSEQRIEKESRELTIISGEIERLKDELVAVRQDKEQISKDLEQSKHKSEMLSQTYDECRTRIDELLVDQSRKEQEITKLKNQIAASATANIITLRKENNNLRTAVRVLERTKVEKDNENAAILLQLREYQRKYGAFGSTYAYDYPVGQGVTVADGVKRASIPSDKRRCPFCKREFTSADQSKIFTHVQKCTGAQ